jgi:queuine tRNA-ribosyltransferase
MLLTWHNIAFYQQIMRELREAIAEGRLADYARRFAADQARSEGNPGESDPPENDDA